MPNINPVFVYIRRLSQIGRRRKGRLYEAHVRTAASDALLVLCGEAATILAALRRFEGNIRLRLHIYIIHGLEKNCGLAVQSAFLDRVIEYPSSVSDL